MPFLPFGKCALGVHKIVKTSIVNITTEADSTHNIYLEDILLMAPTVE